MSVSSQHARVPNRRVNSLQNGNDRSYSTGRPRRKSINGNDAYLYALRVAYLSYLLQPRAKRTRTIQRPQVARAATSASLHDLMKDFQVVRDSKSEKYPHGFVKALEKRLQTVIKIEDRRPEYQDPQVRRTFAIFFLHYTDPTFHKQIEESKRAEDLVLMFFSKATQELSKGKPPHDDGVKRMVDRHLALFVRLMSSTLKEKGWADERRDLAARLTNLERKLLKHEEDLSSPTAETKGENVEEEIPLTYEAKDMPHVQVVGRIFGLRNTMLQSDIDKHKHEWTEEAALRDLKTYQAHLNMGTRRTLSEADFDTRAAYEEWKKHEAPDLSQMVLAIMQINPTLAKTSGAVNLPQFNPRASMIADGQYAELAKTLSPAGGSSYSFEMPDLNGLQIDDQASAGDDEENVYTFIPADARGTFRYIMNLALTWDLSDQAQGSANGAMPQILSKQSTEFLNELALRWRIPKFSRIVLFLDCIREKFTEQMLTLDQLDAAFNYVKQPVQEDGKNKRSSLVMTSLLYDRFKWTVADFSLMQQSLSALYDGLLRELYGAMMTCYETKQSPLLGSILAIIDDHIKSDPNFSYSEDEFHNFKQQVSEGLENKARETYAGLVEKEIPGEQETWEFYHVMQLGKRVLEKAQKIQKRYRKNPEILGIEPLGILLQCMLPAFAEDSRAMIDSVVETSKAKEQDVPMEDGFELYKELANFRRVYTDALPGQAFPYKLEDVLQEFVWKWINATDAQVMGWVEQAIKHDNFQVRNDDKYRPPTEEERHSNSVLDVFRSFNQVIEQVAKLEWDDDITYAKFMTALSKSLGNGISRYCEVLDQMFHREMDRLTPEQEMAAKQTTQQKYLQYAKDAWNNENRVEPFQFYPESFVKLNDVSFAIQQWDKLESEMNVDACADVIKRHNPPSLQQRRKVTNYVFTIKLVEAEGLKALDVNGFSDPYVVLTDEYQKRLFKTKTIYRNLNPRWDESVDITTQGPLNLIATVWDWDSMKDHDYVGRTSLKLDPNHFGDFLPREYWLNLDTQGRVLVRVSMEGERDDIQFYFGKAFRALQRTQRDMTRNITDKLSAYINHCLSLKTLRQLTNKTISVAKVSSYISSYRNRNAAPTGPTGPTEADIANALTPLFKYFDDNFFIMNQTLTPDAMIAVMTRLWKEVLMTIESLLVPALSDLPSQQKQLSQPELDIVFKWLQSLFDFFNAVDEDTGQANGVPTNVLKSPKYHEIQTLNFFYFETTENLVRTSERMASATAQSQQAQRSRLSAPAHLGAPSSGGLLAAGAAPGARRAKSIMLARNLGTMRKAKEEKWKAAQAEPSDDMILRILRMRPEAAGYLKDRSRQKERLAAAAAAEMIVRQSLMSSGGGRMTGPSVIRR
ncbi:hypothetical protein LTR70_008981 [Exophiala xenobiotica]|uniref:C2 domain containing protein n=1 Tax=Lithohypha guttulata TaxID=1690604 RepID=A0ABR0JYN5_9EURO|nr:hypothetical protein LTR24_008924 [Lithohypha guttulata]KAK5311136.1 hypothetical protein LTR70_008981 [Exophiala xenobiotica]